MFQTYLQLGFDHIADLRAYDHILFIITLCVVYALRQWKQLLILVTAFTVGHSITLALASLQIISLPEKLIEVLIPVTIAITAISNLVRNQKVATSWKSLYFLPLIFGLIHGMGFSNYFRTLLGREADIVLPLLAFNIGVELGQLIIVFVFLLVTWLATKFAKIPSRVWIIIISSVGLGLAINMIIERLMS